MSLATERAIPTLQEHLHVDDEICPLCEQLIPNDRLEQVKARHTEHQREIESQYALKAKAEREQLVHQLRKEKEEALAQAQQDSAAKEAAARAAERNAVTAEMQSHINAATQAAQTAGARNDELKQLLDAATQATVEKVNEARASAITEANNTWQGRLVAAESAAQAGLDRLQVLTEKEQNAQTEILKLTQAISAAREEGKEAAKTELQTQLNAAHAERESALQAKATTEQQLQTLREDQEKNFARRVQEVREALEKSQRDALNAEQAKQFEEKQKFQNKLEDLQRQLDNKTAQELGEGAEVNLFEALKAEFPEDDITRVARGVAGADIRHMVRHNGNECGLILYDSKNHKAWRTDFVTKLRDDQIAAKADHAVLSTIAFPQGTKQLHFQDGVLIVNPARAIALVKVLRQHVTHVHCLRLSNEDREEKATALYDFITSERFGALTTKLHVTTDSLADLDIREQAVHKLTWQKRGQLINGIVKAKADLRAEIDRIIGTAAGNDIDQALDEMLHDTTAAAPESP